MLGVSEVLVASEVLESLDRCLHMLGSLEVLEPVNAC